MREPSRLRDLLSEAGSGLGVDRAVEAGVVWAKWQEIVGDAIAQHAEPTSLRRGTLKIRALSPAWATEIGYLREQIMRAANDRLGSPIVTEVQVWTSSEPLRRRPRAQDPKSTVASTSEGAAKAPPDDPEEAFERARAAWLRRRSRNRSAGPGKPENPW